LDHTEHRSHLLVKKKIGDRKRRRVAMGQFHRSWTHKGKGGGVRAAEKKKERGGG